METKICPNCQSEVAVEAVYCTVCGMPQANRAEAYPPEPTPQQWPRQEVQHAPPEQQQKKSKPAQVRYHAENGTGMGWIVFMRVILWILFSTVVIGAVVRAIVMFSQDLVLDGIMTILIAVLAAFVVIGGGMVALNSASNSRKTANNTAKILQFLQEQSKK